MTFTSTSRDGAITSQTQMLLWERDSTSPPAVPAAAARRSQKLFHAPFICKPAVLGRSFQ